MPKFIEAIKKINSAVRGAYYAHLEHSDDKTINDERKHAIEIWQLLGAEGENFESTLTPQDWERHSATTISFDELVTSNTRYGSSSRGQETLYGSIDGDINTYDPTYYDDTFGTARSIVMDHDKGSFVGKVFKEAVAGITEKIEQLKGMSASDFRQYKLGQLSLQPGEKDMFEAKIDSLNMDKSQEFVDEGLEGPRL